MQELVPGWNCDVDRGPDWLFVRIHSNDDGSVEGMSLAESLWTLLEQHFTYRIVLELDQLKSLRTAVIGQLLLLQKRVHKHDGLFRLSGLSEANQQILRTSQLGSLLPQFRSREEAVMGYRPSQPR